MAVSVNERRSVIHAGGDPQQANYNIEKSLHTNIVDGQEGAHAERKDGIDMEVALEELQQQIDRKALEDMNDHQYEGQSDYQAPQLSQQKDGYRKAPIKGRPACCYDCVPCGEGEISNRTDSDNCLKCQSLEWPNKKKDQCVPKIIDFLSYTNDIVAVIFSLLSISFTSLTSLILGIFIFFLNTPLVKANNKNLSFLLLVSIMLSYLCVFLFLGRPVDITCMLRHTAFGIIFSVAVSSVLAKTLMVGIVFKAIKPDSKWRKWVGVKLSNSVVIVFSSIQIIICTIWLVASPPFQEINMRSDPGKVIIQCNEGSVFAFYSMLGYMGLLAAVSFVIAFYTRTLPDNFNEAKFITFSMLVFCSVWIAMIPAYLSTNGKQMVAVEIFAILASNTGLLGCIFVPKCYIILFRSDMNTKQHLLGNIKK
ncbi:vomeronasal type-2 receptor 26-like [Discoglossus pictus]